MIPGRRQQKEYSVFFLLEIKIKSSSFWNQFPFSFVLVFIHTSLPNKKNVTE